MALTEGATDYLRIQDVGNREQEQPDGLGGFTVLGMATATAASTSATTSKTSIPPSHRFSPTELPSRFAPALRREGASTTCTPTSSMEGEVPDLQEITPWPAGGKGYNVKDDGKGIFTVQQNG